MKPKHVALLVVAVILLLFGSCVGLVALISGLIFKSEPVVLVVKMLESDQDVAAVTGTPIELKIWGGSISISTSGSGGHADMDTTAYGPKGNMRFVANLVKEHGDWRATYLALYPHGVKVVRIDALRNLE